VSSYPHDPDTGKLPLTCEFCDGVIEDNEAAVSDPGHREVQPVTDDMETRLDALA
jgi:hypothetical protein